MDAVGGLVMLVVTVVVLAMIFLVCRAVVLWYWKVDKIVSLLESIDAKLGSENARAKELKGSSVGLEY